MQSVKDSFYMTLRERLAALNPNRTVVLEGTPQPAIVVIENEIASGTPVALECFRVAFGTAQIAQSHRTSDIPLMSLECTVSYTTRGGTEDGVGRGRLLGALDQELLDICLPPRTAICDYTKTPPANTRTNTFWDRPELGEVEDSDGQLSRSAKLMLFFFIKEAA